MATTIRPSSLPSAGTILDGDVIPIDGVSGCRKVAISDMITRFGGGGGGGGSGTVTSVALTTPNFLSVAGSPITGSGTLAVTLATQSANLVFAGPASGSAATPAFRSLVPADLPGIDSLLPSQTGNSGKALVTDGTSASWQTVSGGGGSGTVTSVALTVPNFLSVAGSPITGSGTLAVSLATQSANQVFAGPASGSAAAPAFRSLAAADLPSALTNGTTIAGSPPASSDNSTAIATTAWVNSYTAPIANDGSGHYIFGGGSAYTIYSGYTASLTVNGGLVANSSQGEHRLINSYSTTDGSEPGYLGNVLSIQAADAYLNSAIRFISSDNYECGAIGWVNNNVSISFTNTLFISASWKLPIDGSSTSPAAPNALMILRQGSWNNNGTGYNSGLVFHPNWDINLHTPWTPDLLGTTEVMVRIPMTPTNSGSQVNYGTAELQVLGTPRIYDTSGTANTHSSAQFTAKNGAGHVAIMSALADNASYNAYPANGMWIGGDGPGGVAVMATNSSGAIQFFTGGDTTAKCRLTIDSSGNFIASNVVTSAPSASLANGQYQFCVYDNSGTAVFEVRYKDSGGTVKVGTFGLS